MRRGQLGWLGMVPFFVVAGWAQERPNGFYLTSPLNVSAGYDANFVVNGTALDDTVAIITAPTFSWIKSTHRATFFVDYQPEFEVFSRHRNLDAWNHSATLRYSYRINSRLSLDAGDSFLSTEDASRSLADSQFLIPRGRFDQNSFFAGLKYRFGHRTQLFFRFDNAIATMTPAGTQTKVINQMTNAGTVTLDHTVDRHHSVTGSYSYLRIRPLDRDGLAGYSYQGMHALNAGYMYTLNPGFIFRATAGVVRTSRFTYTGGAAVEKRLGGLWLMAGYQRYLSFFGGFTPTGGAGGTVPSIQGSLPNSLFQAALLGLRGKLTKRVDVEFRGQRGRGSLGDRSVRSMIAQSRLDYRLSERFTVFACAEYYGQNVGQFSASPLSRRRYFGGLEIVLSHPPVSENARLRRGQIPTDAAERQAGEPHAPEER
jgi:hypothetical protein